MPSDTPGRFSVIVPTRDSAATLPACLRSIIEQHYPNIELIVVDNYSTDNTGAIAQGYGATLMSAGPERSKQRNVGALHATGEWLWFLDSDMILTPGALAEAATAFQHDAHLSGLVIPELARAVGYWGRCRQLEKHMYLGDPDIEAARLFRRAAFMAIGGYDETIHGGGEDWDLPERLLMQGGKIGRIRTTVLHDEGRLRMSVDLRKKFYYGRTLSRYASKHPRGALRKAARLAFLRHADELIADPVHGVGLLVLKALEYSAAAFGVLVATFRRHPADGQASDTPQRSRRQIGTTGTG